MRSEASEAAGAPRDGLLLVAVLAMVTLAHAGALLGDFAWDDQTLILRQPAVLELEPPHRYFTTMFWSNPEFDQSPAFYRPLVTLSYAIEFALWGPDPLFFHLTNLLAHLACAAAVFWLARRAGAHPLGACLAALLFGLFPRGTESVAWVSGRTDLFATLAALLAWGLHRSAPDALGARAAAAAAVGLGLFCKEVALAGAVAIAALEASRWRWRHQDAARTLRNLAPVACALAVYGVARGAAWLTSGSQMRPDLVLDWADRPLLALQALGTYAGMLADPLRPRLLIGVKLVREPLWIAVGAVVAVLLVWGCVVLARRGRNGMVWAAAAFALAGIAPVLHLVSLPVTVVATDRYLYLPAAGLAVLLAAGAARLSGARARAAAGVAALAVPLFGVATVWRVAEWSDDLTLFRKAVQHAPAQSAMAHVGLGEALHRMDRCDLSLPLYREALRRRVSLRQHFPEDAAYPEYIIGNLALCLMEAGRHREAVPMLQETVHYNPTAPLNRHNLALALAQQLRFDAAEEQLERALELYPGYPRATALQDTLGQARTQWEALPPPSPDEPTSVKAARARVFVLVGHRPAADALWSRVLEAGDAAPADLHAGALYLVLQGPPEAGRRAVERLKGVPALRAEARELEEALAARIELRRATEAS